MSYKRYGTNDIIIKNSAVSSNINSSSYSSVVYSNTDSQYKYIRNLLYTGSKFRKSTEKTSLYTGSITVVTCPRSVYKDLIISTNLNISNESTPIYVYNSSNKDLSNTNIMFKNSILQSGSTLIGAIINSYGTIVLYDTYNSISVTNSYNKLNQYNNIYFSRMLPHEFNKSSNPTWSSSINYTYITTIGLYDLNNNLLAVGRLSRPIKKDDLTERNFKVKIIK